MLCAPFGSRLGKPADRLCRGVGEGPPARFRPVVGGNIAFELVRDEGPGILHWLIEGAQIYLRTRAPPHRPHLGTTRNQGVRKRPTRDRQSDNGAGRVRKSCGMRRDDAPEHVVEVMG